jgi:hypothetical protein
VSAHDPSPPPGSLVAWRDFERHERRTDDEHKAIRSWAADEHKAIWVEVKDLNVRVDRVESVLDQMRGIRALIVGIFGASVISGLLGVVTLVITINGGP